jgi:hypothetical protein
MSASTSFIGRGMAWLTQQLQDHDSVAVVYARGIERVDVKALYFEVLPLPGEPGWRDDPHGTAWRIHTKRVR